MSDIYLTKKGLKKFEEELTDLTKKRIGAVSNLSRAREMGDLSENGFYKAARNELSNIDRRIRELSYMIKNARVIKKSRSDSVALGDTVKLLSDGKNLEYQIVGKYEANPSEEKISNESPIGRLVLGKKVGEEFNFADKSFKILEIN